MSKNLPEKPEKLDMVVNGHGIEVKNLGEAYKLAVAVHKSGLVPTGLNSPEKVLVAAQVGMEAGLSFMAAVKSVYVIKGTPAWYGKAAKGLILHKGLAKKWNQGWKGEGENRVAWVRSMRKGMEEEQETTFSALQAKRMGLWGKSDPWRTDPDNMLMWRCIGRHCDQWYADVLLGMPLVEVVKDDDWKEKDSTAPEAPDTPDPLLESLQSNAIDADTEEAPGEGAEEGGDVPQEDTVSSSAAATESPPEPRGTTQEQIRRAGAATADEINARMDYLFPSPGDAIEPEEPETTLSGPISKAEAAIVRKRALESGWKAAEVTKYLKTYWQISKSTEITYDIYGSVLEDLEDPDGIKERRGGE